MVDRWRGATRLFRRGESVTANSLSASGWQFTYRERGDVSQQAFLTLRSDKQRAHLRHSGVARARISRMRAAPRRGICRRDM